MKKNLLIIVLVFIIALVAVVLSSLQKKAPAESPVQQKGVVGFKNLTPGVSTEKDVTRALGSPTRKDVVGKTSTLVYPSGLGTQPINIALDPGGSVTIIKEPIGPDGTLGALSSSLGQPSAVLYGDFARLGFQLLVYLSNGEALLASPTTGEVKERWSFAPTTLTVFKSAFAPTYQDKPPQDAE